MPHRQGKRYPNVSVEILLIDWPRRGIAMDVGSFHVGPVPLGGRVVDDRQQPIRQRAAK
jgi:hypothetical protein